MKSADSDGLEQLFHTAAGLSTAQRAEFLKTADPELAATVRSMLNGACDPRWNESALETEARATAMECSAPQPGVFLGPYRIVRRIAGGGMSVVYEAVRDDTEFHKQVAIKFVQQGIGDAAAIERFRMERQILAQLEHPHIARLLDGGTTPEGIPYLVMEFVEGVPIDQFVAEHRSTRPERLRLFLSVCEAVAYAHRNLVVHRDLKPANILVNRDGAPKLLDFGIAKVLTPDTRGQTVAALTPEYASPEQLLARSITTATDIYSLGVLLFVLLAGHLPHEASSPADLVRAICERDPVWPSGGLIDRDLQSILSLCMRKEPERRYSSVEQLSADLRRYLDGRPVAARSGAFLYRAGKFVRRRAIPLAAAVAASGLAAAGIFSIIEQSRRVERRFNEVRTLAHSVLFESYDAIKVLPGSLAARRQLAGEAQKYLDGLARENTSDRRLVLDLTESYRRLGDVRGAPYAANLGDAPGAMESYRKAHDLLDRWLRPNSSDAEMELEFARVDMSLARLLTRQNQLDEATALLNGAAQRFEALVNRFPKQGSYREALAQAYQSQGELFGAKAGRSHAPTMLQAVAASQKSLEMFKSSGPRTDDDWRASLSAKYFALGYSLQQAAQLGGDRSFYRLALDAHLEGLAVVRTLFDSRPGQPSRRLADALMTVALARWYCCYDLDRALPEVREALDTLEHLADAEPQNLEAKRDLGNALAAMGLLLGEAGHKKEAIAADRRAIAIFEQLDRADPTSYENRERLEVVRSRVAGLK